jgi:hypothetical protein
MANPTTNYGFVLPTSTDLVTDLPADFDVALQGVDTQMFTNANAAVAKSIVDAKGDLIAGTADNTVARRSIGANNTVLTADSAEATGMKWATPAAGGMTLLSTTTLSGASTTISGISQDYNDLQIIIYGVTNATADGNFGIDPNANSALTYNVWSRGATLNNSAAESLWLNYFNTYLPLRTSAANNWTLTINNYADTTYYKSLSYFGGYTTSVNLYPTIGYGTIATNSAITSLRFQNAGGNLSTGTVEIYGVK